MNVPRDGSMKGFLNNDLLWEEIMKHLPNDQAQLIAKREGIDFSEVRKLRVQFKEIRSIDNLWKFTSLTRLELNNNLIEKIEGLDLMVNLTWLDLSFNSIKKIGGLDSLRKLEVLNLTRNRISVIENMSTLENLTHFFIAKNCLEEQDNVLYLRRFKKLFALTLGRNPAFNGDDYKLVIAIYLPNLKFIDDTLIDKEMKNEASIKYGCILETLTNEGLQRQQAEEAKQRQEAEVKLHKDAFVEELNGPYLFESMFKDDPKAETLHRVPGVPLLLQTFEQQTVELCMKLFEEGLAEHKRRQAELNLFTSGVTETKEDFKRETGRTLAEFDEQHEESTGEMLKLSDPNLQKAKIQHCHNEIDGLKKSLIEMELHLFSELERVTKMFDINISEMVSSFTDTTQGIFAQIRVLEDKHYEKVQGIALAALKSLANDDQHKDFPDDVKMLFTDKDTVMDELAACHENHLLKINNRETQLVTRLNSWRVALIKDIQDKELKEHRKRLRDILRYGDFLKEWIEKSLRFRYRSQF